MATALTAAYPDAVVVGEEAAARDSSLLDAIGTADFAFVFAPEHWGRGIATEACRAALPRLSGFAVRTVFATVDSRNSRSIRLLERLGFGEVPPEAYPHGRVQPGDRVFALSLA